MRFDARTPLRLGIALAALAMGCGAPSGLTVNVMAGGDVPRPQALSISWLSGRGTIYQKDQVPVREAGPLASIFVELDRADTSDRRLLVRGMGPGTATSIGALRIANAAASQTLEVTLRATMPDSDGDGIPDVIDDCPDGPACGKTADAGVAEEPGSVAEPDASAGEDATAELAPDAGAPPADSATPPPPDAGEPEPPPPALPGLVGLWRMEEGSGTSIKDSSPTGNTATIMRATGYDFTQGQKGAALSLTGGNWLSIPPSTAYDAQNGLTLSAWVFYSRTSGAIMARQRNNPAQNAFWLGLDPTRLHFSVEDQGVNVPAPPVNRWVHVAGTFDGSKTALYLDGVPVAIALVTARPAASSRPVSVGADLNGGDPTVANFQLVGRLDEVAIFNRALSQAEISALMK